MLVRLPQSTLWPVLQHIGRAIAPRPVIPLLSGIHVQANDEGLSLTASSPSMSLRCRLDGSQAAIERSGCIVIPAPYWIEIVRHTSASDTITLEALDGWRLRIIAGRAMYHLNGMNPEGYPIMNMEQSDEKVQLLLASDRLRKVIQQVAFAASNSESRPILSGVLCQLSGGILRMTSTDGIRLASRTIGLLRDHAPLEDLTEDQMTVSSTTAMSAQVVIPAKHLLDFARAVSNEPGTTVLTLNRHRAILETSGFAMQSVVLEGAYPPIDKILSTAHAACRTVITVNTCRLLQALKRTALLSGDGNVVRLHCKPDGIMALNAYQAEIGDVQEEIEVSSVSGEPLAISCNARLMADLVEAVDHEQVTLQMSDQQSPIIVTPASRDSAFYALTPIRTRDVSKPAAL